MLQNLENLVRENARETIVNNQAIPNEKNEAAIQAASSSIVDILKEKLSSGDISGLINSFKQGDLGGDTAQAVSNKFTDKLQGLGINLDSAKSIAASLIPSILAKFTQKTNDPNDSSFNLQDIVGQVAGEDGKFQMSDLTNLFNQENSPQGSTGDNTGNDDGIMGKIKGLF